MSNAPAAQRSVSPAVPNRTMARLQTSAATVALVLFLLTVVFVIFSALPSDPVRNALGTNASEEAVRMLRRDLGYDQPIGERYVRFLAGAVRLDFGRSIHSRREVRPMVVEALAITARNGAGALCASALMSIVLAVVARMSMTAERGILFVCRLFTSIPSLIVAIAAGVAAYGLMGGFAGGDLRAMVGIVAALAVYPTCSLAEIAIGEARRVERCTFVTAARSFGMSEPMIFVRCILPAILTSWVGHVSNVAASIFVSSSVFDAVFSLPGIGHLLAQSVVQNDLPVVQGLIIVIIVGFLAVDALFDRVLLPRLATYGRAGVS